MPDKYGHNFKRKSRNFQAGAPREGWFNLAPLQAGNKIINTLKNIAFLRTFAII